MSWGGPSSRPPRHGGFSQGRYRGGRGSGRPTEPAASPALPYGPLIETLKPTDLDEDAALLKSDAAITDVETVASYSWLDQTKTPTILTPGMPPRWTPPATPPQLAEDNGVYFCDKNAAHYARHPIEPAVRVSLAADPALPRSVDVVACGATLGNLLRFVRGREHIHGTLKTFRMLAEDVHGTLFLVRRENTPTERIRGVYGYGHTFPEAYTTWDRDVRGSTSHQRVIRYAFGGLNLLLLFECDGYLAGPKEAEKQKEQTPNSKTAAVRKDADADDDWLQGLEKLALNSEASTATATATATADDIDVKTGGRLVEQSQVLEIKTRSVRKRGVEDTLATELPRLWSRQIDHLVLAYHERGTFTDVQVLPVRDAVRAFEHDTQADLGRLAALLHRLVTAVQQHPDRRLEITLEAAGALNVRAQTPGMPQALSPSVDELWRQGLVGDLGPIETVDEDEVEDEVKDDVNNPDDADDTSDSGGVREPTKKMAGSSTSSEDDDETASLVWEDAEDDSADYTACTAVCGYCGQCK